MTDIRQIMDITAVIPVVTLERAEDAPDVARALLAGGIGVIEITLRTPAGFAAMAAIRDQVPDMCVGAGTVWRATEARKAVASGAAFVVSPGISDEVGDTCRATGTAYLPGAQTVSEVAHLVRRGERAVKIFPASSIGGARTLRAYASVFPDTLFCPTGGIDESSLNDYLRLERVPCVGGSWIVKASDVDAGNYRQISALAERAVEQAGAAIRTNT